MKTVLVTRPQPLADFLAKRLHEAGYRPLVEPLLILTPLFTPLPKAPENAALLITSRLVFSVLAVRRRDIAPFLDRPCYCVGAQTGAEARTFGFADVRVGEGDGRGLVRMIQEREPEDRPLLHIGGEDVSHEVHDFFSATGRRVVRWTLYKAQAVSSLSAPFKEALEGGGIDAALFYSTRTAQIFVKLVQKAGLGACCAGLTAIGLSEAVVAPLAVFPWQRVLIADEPNEERALSCLFRFLPVT